MMDSYFLIIAQCGFFVKGFVKFLWKLRDFVQQNEKIRRFSQKALAISEKLCYTIYDRVSVTCGIPAEHHYREEFIMSFFDQLKANLTNAGRTAQQAAKNMSDSSALKREMNTEKSNIQQKYLEIGQTYYEQHQNDPADPFAEQIASITASAKHIEELEAEIQAVQSRKADLVPVPQTTAPAAAPQPTAMVCMQCGATYDTTQIFCASCGQKLTPQYSTPAAAAAAPAQTAEDVQQQPVAPEAAPETDAPAPDAPNTDSEA